MCPREHVRKYWDVQGWESRLHGAPTLGAQVTRGAGKVGGEFSSGEKPQGEEPGQKAGVGRKQPLGHSES